MALFLKQSHQSKTSYKYIWKIILRTGASLCPTQRGCYGLARHYGATESQTSEAVGAFF